MLVKNVYGHLGDVRARGEFVEYRQAIVEEIQDEKTRRDFENRFKNVARRLQLVA
jgi:hypothetical protein